jgi:glycerol-3-phosphate acyltransferase PlsY
MDMFLSWVTLILLCYLFGSIPTAHIITRLLTGRHIQTMGDHNAGSANVWREIGPKAGLVTFVVDIGKGAGTVLATQSFMESPLAPIVGGLAAIMGHNWPPYLHIRGGRGAATLLGVLVTIWPSAGFPLAVVGIVLWVLTRSVLPSLVMFYIAFPAVSWITGASLTIVGLTIPLMVLVGATHWFTTRVRT